jgi:hypothetical protein
MSEEKKTSERCEHVGKEHPIHFQCADCDDTADKCNCNNCVMVFCNLCQKMLFVDCDEVCSAWVEQHPDLNMDIEGIKIELAKKRRSRADGCSF